jgi:uncharacterized protein (TIGR03084 family)
MSMAEACEDLAAEAAELRALVRGAVPEAVTPFEGWRVRDVVEHMVTIDRLATLSLTDAAAFNAEQGRFVEGTKPPSADRPRAEAFARIKAYETSRLAFLSWAQLLAAWDAGLAELIAAGRGAAEDAKVGWFGPPMRARTLINARQMEVWGYGQDVFDLMRARRAEGERLRNVAEFGVRTMGFCFANHGLPAPDPKPFVALTSPGGATWAWNDPGADSRVEGSAVDFCRVAVQRRNVADTALKVTGEAARTWMRIAQCIAGPPAEGPAPGVRAWDLPGAAADA